MSQPAELAAPIGELKVGFLNVTVVQFDAKALTSLPVDQRVRALSEVLQQRQIAVVSCDPYALTDEPRVDFGSVTRGKIIQSFEAAARQDSRSTPESIRLTGIGLLADSLPDCTIELNPGVQAPGRWPDGLRTLWFTPADVHALAVELGVFSKRSDTRRWVKRNWQAKLMRLEDLARKFEQENREWPREDASRFDEPDPAREALSKHLGMSDDSAAIRQNRAYGRQIGEAVGSQQRHGWLATDLKLEHFPSSSGRVFHVDHEDDVFLFRPPTAREMAACIAPLYQQMTYLRWQAFREGLINKNGATAVRVLFELEGPAVLEALCDFVGKAASRARRAGQTDTALEFCAALDAAAALAQGIVATKFRAKAALIRGDVLGTAARYPEASRSYHLALTELEALREQGMTVDAEMCGGLVNLAMITDQLGAREDACELLRRAEAHAQHVQRTNSSHGEHLMRAIRANKQVLTKSPGHP